LSQEFKNLIQGMLRYDVNSRVSIEDIMNSEWVKSSNDDWIGLRDEMEKRFNVIYQKQMWNLNYERTKKKKNKYINMINNNKKKNNYFELLLWMLLLLFV